MTRSGGRRCGFRHPLAFFVIEERARAAFALTTYVLVGVRRIMGGGREKSSVGTSSKPILFACCDKTRKSRIWFVFLQSAGVELLPRCELVFLGATNANAVPDE